MFKEGLCFSRSLFDWHYISVIQKALGTMNLFLIGPILAKMEMGVLVRVKMTLLVGAFLVEAKRLY